MAAVRRFVSPEVSDFGRPGPETVTRRTRGTHPASPRLRKSSGRLASDRGRGGRIGLARFLLSGIGQVEGLNMSAVAMSAVTPIPAEERTEAVETTLLELVRAVDEVADNELEVVVTVLHMLRSGSVKLSGNFRGSLLLDVDLGEYVRQN